MHLSSINPPVIIFSRLIGYFIKRRKSKYLNNRFSLKNRENLREARAMQMKLQNYIPRE